MRILFLTPGTGSFYCGTCLRDNALAVALRRRGHDALLVPLYLPPTLDEASASEGAPLFYGGVNVYLQQKAGLFRKTPRFVDRLLDTPAVLAGAAKRAGMTKASELGEITLSMLRGEEGHQVKELDRLADWLASEGRADIVVLSNALLAGLARRIREKTGARVACTLQGEDTFLDALEEPYRARAWATLAARAKDIDVFLAVSRYHADLMTRRAALPPARVQVVYNGISLEGYAPAAAAPSPPALGYFARMCPPKGLETLVEAFLLLATRRPDLQLRVAGAQVGPDVAYVERLKTRLSAAGLAERIAFFPNVDRAEKIAFLQSLTVFSVPALYGESFGLYVIEALAAGVPLVQPRHAVFPELLAQTGGGVLYDPEGGPAALADAVEGLLADPAKARALGDEGRRHVFEGFSAETMASRFEQAVAP